MFRVTDKKISPSGCPTRAEYINPIAFCWSGRLTAINVNPKCCKLRLPARRSERRWIVLNSIKPWRDYSALWLQGDWRFTLSAEALRPVSTGRCNRPVVRSVGADHSTESSGPVAKMGLGRLYPGGRPIDPFARFEPNPMPTALEGYAALNCVADGA